MSDNDRAIHKISIYVTTVASGITAVMIAFFLLFLVKMENRDHVFAPFNVVLLVGSLFVFFAQVSVTAQNIMNHNELRYIPSLDYPYLSFVNVFCIASAELCFTIISWLRSRSIVGKVFPKLPRMLKVFVYVSPAFYYFQLVPETIELIPVLRVQLKKQQQMLLILGSILSGATTLLFDTIL
ncbi:hypothetical protein BCR33DRAFT_764500 [Rhizoclosmatium globosum]|uniref:Uncharacterized protein n=1 Tax=Rhizoclosmatium globosum TaxID=329046 RepID=A0A1Y2CIA2_9FUNG|nr:hypothetical protein BCR33DRAFT_764500 [Rhizoclosmatium globosum]|eukprot:ORY46773.1 hypothetical protein BCR33DRAFT_764500 [Rhizoclosmatium globosum]